MTLISPCDTHPFGGLLYKMVKGKPLVPLTLTKEKMINLAKSLVEFNKQIHSINEHWNRDSSIRHEIEKIKNNIEILKNYLKIEEINTLNGYLVEFSSYISSKQNFCITHGDLWADNLIVDENNNLVGIIDFGNMSYFLPEVDYASLWDMTDTIVDEMLKFSDEDITKQSINLFILHREVCCFEYILETDQSEINSQIKKIRLALTKFVSEK